MRISSDKWTGKEVDKSGKFVRQKNRFDTPFGEEEGQLPENQTQSVRMYQEATGHLPWMKVT